MYLRRRRNRRSGQLLEISLTPLIDTALTLLIIFMIATPMIQNSIKVNLPRGNAKEHAGKQEELVVWVTKDAASGKEVMFFDNKEITEDALIPALKERVGPQQQETVFVKGDAAVTYGRIIELVDQIKVIGGIQYVALATQKRT